MKSSIQLFYWDYSLRAYQETIWNTDAFFVEILEIAANHMDLIGGMIVLYPT